MTDKEIVRLYWAREEKAIEQTKLKYEIYLMKMSYNILNDKEDSQEAVNDTYLAAWNSMPENRPDNLKLYLGTIIRRISIDFFRKRISRKRSDSEFALSYEELGDCLSDSLMPDQEFEAKELALEIQAFLMKLKKKERVAFVRRYYYSDPMKEIAEGFKMTEGSMKTMLFRIGDFTDEVLTIDEMQINIAVENKALSLVADGKSCRCEIQSKLLCKKDDIRYIVISVNLYIKDDSGVENKVPYMLAVLLDATRTTK